MPRKVQLSPSVSKRGASPKVASHKSTHDLRAARARLTHEQARALRLDNDARMARARGAKTAKEAAPISPHAYFQYPELAALERQMRELDCAYTQRLLEADLKDKADKLAALERRLQKEAQKEEPQIDAPLKMDGGLTGRR